MLQVMGTRRYDSNKYDSRPKPKTLNDLAGQNRDQDSTHQNDTKTIKYQDQDSKPRVDRVLYIDLE